MLRPDVYKLVKLGLWETANIHSSEFCVQFYILKGRRFLDISCVDLNGLYLGDAIKL